MNEFRVWCINGDFDSSYDNPFDAEDRVRYLMENCECDEHTDGYDCYFYDEVRDGYIVR